MPLFQPPKKKSVGEEPRLEQAWSSCVKPMGSKSPNLRKKRKKTFDNFSWEIPTTTSLTIMDPKNVPKISLIFFCSPNSDDQDTEMRPGPPAVAVLQRPPRYSLAAISISPGTPSFQLMVTSSTELFSIQLNGKKEGEFCADLYPYATSCSGCFLLVV